MTVLIDLNDKKWVLFETMTIFLCVTDYETETQNEVLHPKDVKEIIQLPENVESLFLKRRAKNLAGLEEFFK